METVPSSDVLIVLGRKLLPAILENLSDHEFHGQERAHHRRRKARDIESPIDLKMEVCPRRLVIANFDGPLSKWTSPLDKPDVGAGQAVEEKVALPFGLPLWERPNFPDEGEAGLNFMLALRPRFALAIAPDRT